MLAVDRTVPPTRLEDLLRLSGFCASKDFFTLSEPELEGLLEYCDHHCYWPFMLDIGVHYLAALGDSDLEKIAWAAWQMGDVIYARALFDRLLIVNPKNSRLSASRQQLDNWITFSRQFSMGLDYPCEDGLYLQLLGHHHLDSFMAIYDESVAERCCLPWFVDASDWHQWLDEQYLVGDQLTFAVMHSEMGMIGSVSLVLHDRTGFFYYWIGNDFRGRGYGPDAVRLLLGMAEQYWGLEHCYAKVFEDNENSRSGLRKLGFSELPIRAAPPFETELFYCLGEQGDLDLVTEHMYWFYQQMNCWKPFTRPLVARAGAGI